MILGLAFLSGGLYLFILTYYSGKISIIIIGSLGRFFNGVVSSYFLELFLLS